MRPCVLLVPGIVVVVLKGVEELVLGVVSLSRMEPWLVSYGATELVVIQRSAEWKGF